MPFYHLINPCNTTVRYVLFLSSYIKCSSDNSEFSKMGEDLNPDIGPKGMNFLPLWAASLCTFRYYFRVTNRKSKSNHCINISDVLNAI